MIGKEELKRCWCAAAASARVLLRVCLLLLLQQQLLLLLLPLLRLLLVESWRLRSRSRSRGVLRAEAADGGPWQQGDDGREFAQSLARQPRCAFGQGAYKPVRVDDARVACAGLPRGASS
jgi:hypothetical protein